MDVRKDSDVLRALAVIMEHIDDLEGDDRGQLASYNWHWFNFARKAIENQRHMTRHLLCERCGEGITKQQIDDTYREYCK